MVERRAQGLAFSGDLALQAQVVSYAKDPSAQVAPRLFAPQVLEQGEERFLNNFLSVVRGKPEREEIAQKRAAQLIEKLDELLFIVSREGSALGARSRKLPPR